MKNIIIKLWDPHWDWHGKFETFYASTNATNKEVQDALDIMQNLAREYQENCVSIEEIRKATGLEYYEYRDLMEHNAEDWFLCLSCRDLFNILSLFIQRGWAKFFESKVSQNTTFNSTMWYGCFE